MKNYADREGYYAPRLKAGVDNIFRDLHNHSHRTKAEFIVLLSIQNICQTLSARFQDIDRCFSCRCCSKSRLKVGNIRRAKCFAYSFAFLPFSFSQKLSYFVFGSPWTPFCFSSLVNYTASRSATPGNEVDRCLVSNQIYHRIFGILLAASKYAQRRLVMKN